MPVGLGVAIAIAAEVCAPDGRWSTWLGGLGAAARHRVARRRAVGAMLLTTAVVICADRLVRPRRVPHARRRLAETRARSPSGRCCSAVWAALNAGVPERRSVHLYVALELLTFAAVPLVSSTGAPRRSGGAALPAVRAAGLGALPARRGAALRRLRHARHRPARRRRARPSRPTWVAAALMTVGLLAKTALFPLHLWLPPAHAGAPAPASAVLSALVVKGSFFIIVRLWFDVMPGGAGPGRRPAARRAGRGRDPVRQRAGAAPGAAQAPDRLLDARADRLFVPDVSAGRRPGVGPAGERRRADRRDGAARLARHRQGGDVHGCGPDLRGARPRPHRRSRPAPPARCP